MGDEAQSLQGMPPGPDGEQEAARAHQPNALERVIARTRSELWLRVNGYRNRSRALTPLFVTGAMGSGTSVVAESFAQRFECAGFINEGAMRVHRSSLLRVQHVAQAKSVEAFAFSLRPRTDWRHGEIRRDLQRLYRSRANRAGHWVVDKTPNANLLRAPFLAECFPEALFVCVIRDPVATIEGFRRKWPLFAAASLAANCRFYEECYGAFLRFARAQPQRAQWVEYERFVADADTTLRRIAAQVELRPLATPRALPPRPNRPGRGLRNVRDGLVHVIDDANAQSYSRLGAQEIEAIQSALDPLYQQLRQAAEQKA